MVSLPQFWCFAWTGKGRYFFVFQALGAVSARFSFAGSSNQQKQRTTKLSNLFTCAKERRPSDEVCCLSHNDTRSNKVCSSSYKDNHFVFQLFWWSTLLSNSKPEMNAFTRILTQKKTTINDILKLLSKRTYLVCYYFRCHGTWVGRMEQKRRSCEYAHRWFAWQLYFSMLRARHSACDFAHACVMPGYCVDTVPCRCPDHLCGICLCLDT